VQAWFTGRRRSQGGARETIPLLEIDGSDGRLKMNPLINWEFDQVPQKKLKKQQLMGGLRSILSSTWSLIRFQRRN
jgi:3'-phosphoadenosine 5'-phosphosulfate sulfotransferase (PAPS reductase)/FAD synthetase